MVAGTGAGVDEFEKRRNHENNRAIWKLPDWARLGQSFVFVAKLVCVFRCGRVGRMALINLLSGDRAVICPPAKVVEYLAGVGR